MSISNPQRLVIGILCYEGDDFTRNWQWVTKEAKKKKVKIGQIIEEIIEFAKEKYEGKLPSIIAVNDTHRKKRKQVYIQTTTDSNLALLYAWVKQEAKRIGLPIRDVLNFIITEYRIENAIRDAFLVREGS